MRFLVLGAGALGGYFGAKLLAAGASVDFLVRPARAAQLIDRGLVIVEPSGETTQSVRPLQTGDVRAPYDVVLLTCKSYDLGSAMDAIAPAVGPGTAIVPVLNGVSHLEILSSRFGQAQVLGGVTLVYASMTPEGVIHRGVAPFDGTMIGELDGKPSSRCEAIAAAFTAASTVTSVSDKIVDDMWRKYFGFAVMATITTLIRARAGEIAVAPAGADYVAGVVCEIANAFAALGQPPPSEDEQLIRGVFAQPGSTYGPSILRDVENGRPTEGAETLGYLVRRATESGIEMPLCTAALCHLQIHESRRLNAPR